MSELKEFKIKLIQNEINNINLDIEKNKEFISLFRKKNSLLRKQLSSEKKLLKNLSK